MLAVIRYVFFLLVLLTNATCRINATSTASSKESLDDAQKSNLRRVVSKMIGVNDGDVERRRGQWSSSDVEPAFSGRGRGRSRLPPRYILRLYERYRSGHIVHGADTVRSVDAELGKCTAN